MDYEPQSDFYSHIAETSLRCQDFVSASERLPTEKGWYLVIFEESEWRVSLSRVYWDGRWDEGCDGVLFWFKEH